MLRPCSLSKHTPLLRTFVFYPLLLQSLLLSLQFHAPAQRGARITRPGRAAGVWQQPPTRSISAEQCAAAFWLACCKGLRRAQGPVDPYWCEPPLPYSSFGVGGLTPTLAQPLGATDTRLHLQAPRADWLVSWLAGSAALFSVVHHGYYDKYTI